MKQTRVSSSRLALASVGALLLVVPACVDSTGRTRTRGDNNQVISSSDTSRPTRDWGPTVTAAVAPPPISGGTLTVLRSNRNIAVAADPDRDRVWIVDVPSNTLLHQVVLEPNDEPGRVVEGAPGRVHVSLRSGGRIADIDVRTGTVLSRREVCSAPRGIAFDGRTQSLHVACAGGELVTLPEAGGAATRTLRFEEERDLRDVVMHGDEIFVSVFRRAEVLTINAAGAIVNRTRAPHGNSFQSRIPGQTGGTEPMVGWRMIPFASDDVMLVHERGNDQPVETGTGGYTGGGCMPPIVESAVSTIRPGGPEGASPPRLSGAVLPVDMALSDDGQQFAVVAAGNFNHESAPQFIVHNVSDMTTSDVGSVNPCGGPTPVTASGIEGQATAVAATPDGWLVQTREPANIVWIARTAGQASRVLRLPGESRADSGHMLFHGNAGPGVACASCHAEGADDGRVWQFAGFGPRRTQNLRGGVAGTAPFHWQGDMTDFASLAHDVFGNRIGGGRLADHQIGALAGYIERIPELPRLPMRDVAAVERGRVLFNDQTVGCANCHSGNQMTNNQTVDVGTGEALQVPRLRGLAFRGPYMHDGCAPTLASRFNGNACGGGDRHGRTSHLAPAQIQDLVRFLETL